MSLCYLFEGNHYPAFLIWNEFFEEHAIILQANKKLGYIRERNNIDSCKLVTLDFLATWQRTRENLDVDFSFYLGFLKYSELFRNTCFQTMISTYTRDHSQNKKNALVIDHLCNNVNLDLSDSLRVVPSRLLFLQESLTFSVSMCQVHRCCFTNISWLMNE